jgi:hypothetical protein
MGKTTQETDAKPVPKRKSDTLIQDKDKITESDEQAKKRFWKGQQLKASIILEDFDLEIESRVKQIENATEGQILSLNNGLQIELFKVPTRIRTMKMSDFCSSQKLPTSIRKTQKGTNQDTITPLLKQKMPKQPKEDPMPSLSHLSSNLPNLSQKARDDMLEQLRKLQMQLTEMVSKP